MNAKELRESLERLESFADFKGSHSERVADAARTIALPILDGSIRPKVFLAISNVYDLEDLDEVTDAVLAAISTPTPGAE